MHVVRALQVSYCMDLYALDREMRVKGRANIYTLLWAARKYLWLLAVAGSGDKPESSCLIEHVNTFKQRMVESRRDQDVTGEALHERLSQTWVPLRVEADGKIAPNPQSEDQGASLDIQKSQENMKLMMRIKAELRKSLQRNMQAEEEARRVKVCNSLATHPTERFSNPSDFVLDDVR